jgi:TrmH family RNA methyltransferase
MIELFAVRDLLDDEPGKALIAAAHDRTIPVHYITRQEMEQVSDTVSAQGVLGIMGQMHQTAGGMLSRQAGSSVIVVLDAVADPGNLGSIVRTCDWFGVDALILGQNCVDVYNPKVVRSTMGSLFHIPVVTNVVLPEFLMEAKTYDYTAYVTTSKGDVQTDEVRYTAKSLFIMGNEAWGVSEDLMRGADVRLAIRRHGAAESLNVGVACGILLAGLRQQTRT